MERELLATCSICRCLHAPVDPLAFEPVCAGCAGEHPFDRLVMRGSYPLHHGAIDDVVTRHSPGNFALGYSDGPNFLVFYIGRSDSDVGARLHAWVGMPSPCAGTPRARGGSGLVRRIRTTAVAAVAAPLAGAATGYTRFAFSYAASADDAFAKECRNYDDFGGSRELDNGRYPVRADRSDLELSGPLRAGRIRIARSFPRPRPHNPTS